MLTVTGQFTVVTRVPLALGSLLFWSHQEAWTLLQDEQCCSLAYMEGQGVAVAIAQHLGLSVAPLGSSHAAAAIPAVSCVPQPDLTETAAGRSSQQQQFRRQPGVRG